MKKFLAVVALFAAIVALIARPIINFTGWNSLIRQSPDIIIAKRLAVPPPPTNQISGIVIGDGLLDYPIEVISSLKGETKPGRACLESPYSDRLGVFPHLGDMFLAFADHSVDAHSNTVYGAFENCRIVPFAFDIYDSFWTNALSGKPLPEQIKRIVKYRLAALNEELAAGEAEKKRLEEFLKAP